VKEFFCYLTVIFFCTQHAYAQPVVERHISLDQCSFRLSDPFSGRVSVDAESTPHSASYSAMINTHAKRPFEPEIRFDCHRNVNASDLSNLAGVSKKNGKWIIDFDGDAGAVNTELYLLSGKGWDGAGITQDQTDGDENRRSRAFTFCLVHGTQALCGSDDTVMYLKNPGESALPQIIRLLDSIEFIN
jgi:hypothetical protein